MTPSAGLSAVLAAFCEVTLTSTLVVYVGIADNNDTEALYSVSACI